MVESNYWIFFKFLYQDIEEKGYDDLLLTEI